MIVTEEEAKTKRCAEVSTPSVPCHCIGSGCMAWRGRWRIIDRDGSPLNDLVFDAKPSNLVDGFRSQPIGFCGKAGKP